MTRNITILHIDNQYEILCLIDNKTICQYKSTNPLVIGMISELFLVYELSENEINKFVEPFVEYTEF